jgi:hypothetical protein
MAKVGDRMPRRPVRLYQAILALFIVILVLTGTGIWYTNRAIDQANRRWCGLLTIIDDLNQKQPSSPNPSVNEYRRQIHDLRAGFRC